ncbi:MAG: hypothetical protein Q8K36_04340 [Alphaproteobacteria bacterium]|nr:hypothetical protein [Alphaproteobacteria bacterium]
MEAQEVFSNLFLVCSLFIKEFSDSERIIPSDGVHLTPVIALVHPSASHEATVPPIPLPKPQILGTEVAGPTHEKISR